MTLGKGANSIPINIGTDKSDTKLNKFLQHIKAHLILSDELFCFIPLTLDRSLRPVRYWKAAPGKLIKSLINIFVIFKKPTNEQRNATDPQHPN